MEPVGHYCVHHGPLLVPHLSQMNPAHIIASYVCQICCDIIFHPTPWPLKGFIYLKSGKMCRLTRATNLFIYIFTTYLSNSVLQFGHDISNHALWHAVGTMLLNDISLWRRNLLGYDIVQMIVINVYVEHTLSVFGLEDGKSRFLQNINNLQNYMVWYPRR
jgi:hypothetical protein